MSRTPDDGLRHAPIEKLSLFFAKPPRQLSSGILKTSSSRAARMLSEIL